jgi:hypothetical protein
MVESKQMEFFAEMHFKVVAIFCTLRHEVTTSDHAVILACLDLPIPEVHRWEASW